MENKKTYTERIMRNTPPSRLGKDVSLAFLFGGGICLTGQAIAEGLMLLGVEKNESYLWVSVIIIALAGLLTSLGVFDKIARYAGAGTLVPVCGFANSIVSSALDTKAEGYITGVGAKIFTVAGPVILYATVSGVLFGIIYYVVNLF